MGASVAETSAIEVYPAATLLAHRIPTEVCKHAKGEAARIAVFGKLSAVFARFRDFTEQHRASDEIDALARLLAAQDFLRGETMAPPCGTSGCSRGRKGWIWVRRPAPS